MYNPISTYRIQFNKDFRIPDLDRIIEYLGMLGSGTVYASPIFQATPGSAHGYDIINPLLFNPEVTDKDDFLKVCSRLQNYNLGWLQDIVPNHMAFHQNNAWLMDVLEKGSNSEYIGFFDLEPGVASREKPLMVPFLGSTLEQAVSNGEVKMGWCNGNFCITYFDNQYPINFDSFSKIIEAEIPDAPGAFADMWNQLKENRKHDISQFYYLRWNPFKAVVQNLYEKEELFCRFIHKIIRTYNANVHLLQDVIQSQYYRLCHWQETERSINFRRFFTVNGLICTKMESPAVFAKYHSFIAEMLQKGCFNGLRIDHIDGLNDPNGYLENLRKLSGKDTYIVAEKILEHDEEFPDFWPIQGNTGYDFLATVNNLLTDMKGYKKLHTLYKEVTQLEIHPADLIYQNKKMILTTRMHGEWDNIVTYFNRLDFLDFGKEKISQEEIKEAIGEFMLACPVYRLYPRRFPLRNHNRATVEEIFARARSRNPALEDALNVLAAILLSKEDKSEEQNRKLEQFFTRLMQFTGPLMAKGVEDTSMYQYNCFIAHNEVGDAINAKGISSEEFHQQMLQRQQNWPLTMNTTSTHDTKRGEDVRARLNVVSELADEWDTHVRKWMRMNQKKKTRLDSGLLEPSLSVEYFIYQTLLGTFPSEGKADEEYLQRIDQYLVKALREAKRKVSWRDPDEVYENAICDFTRNILHSDHDFLNAFLPFQQKIAWRGVTNSLTQLSLKGTAPGVPDIYQGTEWWDLTLVDPDNRQPVDYEARKTMLKQLISQSRKDSAALMQQLSSNPFDGRIKLWLTHILLSLRKQQPELFANGEYIPLEVKGEFARHAMAYARRHQNDWVIVVVPLITGALSQKPKGEYLSEVNWEDTHVVIPDNAPVNWMHLLDGSSHVVKEKLDLKELFKNAGVCLLTNTK